MKKKFIIVIILLLLIISISPGCGKSEIPITGEYEFEDVVYVGGISSATQDYLIEIKSGTKYIINNDSFNIINGDNEILFSNISYKEEKINKDFIKTNYGEIDLRLTEFFNKYEDRRRYSLYDEQGEKINYYIFLMDGEIFLCKYAKADIIIFSIDKLKLLSRRVRTFS